MPPHLSSTQHKHQAPQRFMSPQPSPHQHRMMLNSPRPGAPHLAPHMHPHWQQLKPPKQLYVQHPHQRGGAKGPHRAGRPAHVHPSPHQPRPGAHHAHPPPYQSSPSSHSAQPQSSGQAHPGGHQTHPIRGASSQSYASLYQSPAQLRDETVHTPLKKQQYL